MTATGAGRGLAARLVRAAGRAALLLAALTSAATAAAQSPSGIPPARYQVDQNGVDVARAQHHISVTDLSIGGPGAAGLAYRRQQRRNGTDHPYDWGIFTAPNDHYIVTADATSYEFAFFSLLGFASTDGKGATLSSNGTAYTLTTADGTVVVYDYSTLATGDIGRISRATSLTYPTGERISLAWVSDQWSSGGSPISSRIPEWEYGQIRDRP